jgi:hypothetical protein
MKKLALTALVLSALLTSCETTPYTPATSEDRVGVFLLYDKTFEAVKAALFDLNADIVAGSKESGFLNAKEALDSTAITTIMLGRARIVYVNYNIVFRATDDETKVQLKIGTAYEDGTFPSEGNHERYVKFWDLVRKYLRASAN